MSTKHLGPPDEDDERTLPEYLTDVALTPFRILTSPFASRIYLRTALLILTGLTLLGLSILAYSIFYYTYIPALGFALPLHLQFSPSHAHNPFALIKLPRGIVTSQQRYDVNVQLCLPVVPENVDAGNFMIETEVRGPEEAFTSPAPAAAEEKQVELVSRVLAESSRPALLFPEDALVSTARRVMQLPLLVTRFKSESTCLRVPVLEGVQFEKGWRNQPDVMRVEIAAQGGPLRTLRVQRAEVEWRAEFEGLRWVVYNFRIISFMVGVGTFWFTAMGTTIMMWAGVSYAFAAVGGESKGEQRRRIKDESEDSSSDRNTQRKKIKQEEEAAEGSSAYPTKEEEADVEDEDADFVVDDPDTAAALRRDDSGLGTSLESSSGGRLSIRRRKSEREAG